MTIPVLVHRYRVSLVSLATAISKREGLSPDQVEARVVDGALILEIIGDPLPEEAERAPETDAEIKGGWRARRAAIIASEVAFQKWKGCADATEATIYIKDTCRVSSRKELDHDEAAGAIFDRIAREYALWLEGY